MKKLQDDRIVRKLVDNLDAEGNLYDFVMFIEQLASGELPANNIVLLLSAGPSAISEQWKYCRNEIQESY